MKWKLAAGIFSVVTALNVGAQPIPLYENFGIIDFGTNAPQIDAIAFANYGDFTVSSTLPYDFQNTLNFTNRGNMTGLVGFRFDNTPALGPTRPANNFVNLRGGSVASLEAYNFSVIIDPEGGTLADSSTANFLLISATNVANHGFLSAGSGGILRIEGQNVNLERGGLQILPLLGGGGWNIDDTNFIPELGIEDVYWGLTNAEFAQAITYTAGFVANTPNVPVQRFLPPIIGGGFANNSQLQLIDPIGLALTNMPFFATTNISVTNINGEVSEHIVPTNLIIQAVFIGGAAGNNPNIFTDVVFNDSTIPTNLLMTATVLLSAISTNDVEAEPILSTLFIRDTLAAESNRFLTLNTLNGFTRRPTTYQISRQAAFTDPPTGFSGTPPNSFALPEMFNGGTNFFIFAPPEFAAVDGFRQFFAFRPTNFFAAYAATVDFLPTRPDPVEGFTPAELPGRIEIKADNLNLERTRIRGEGFVSIETDNLLGNFAAAVEAENLSYNISAASGTVNVDGLAKDEIQRLNGGIQLYSAIWSNNLVQLYINYTFEVAADGSSTNITPTLASNVVEVAYHVFFVDTTFLDTTKPVTVFDFKSRSANTFIADNMIVSNSFLITGTALTIDGNVRTTGRIRSLYDTNAPNLRYFTNSGTLTIPSSYSMGLARPTPLDVFVNSGNFNVFSFEVETDYMENNGNFNIDGRSTITAGNIKYDGGIGSIGGDFRITASTLKMRDTTNTVGQALYLSITNEFSDSGGGANVVFRTFDGFNLERLPLAGSLLGTTFDTTAPQFAGIEHTWAGRDLGPVADGFVDNAAIGRLVLTAGSSAELAFSAIAGGTNALYVDELVLNNITLANLANVLTVNPNFRIYFASANVPIEELDGALNGRLRWVRSFAGPNSAVSVALSDGRVILVNRGLRESLTIDSDADGVANGLDINPFDSVAIIEVAAVGNPPTAFTITWEAAANTTYHIEYTTDIVNGEWQLLQTYTNSSDASDLVTVQDAILPDSTQRFYRVRYSP